MLIEIDKIQVDEKKFVDTKDTTNQRQRGETGAVSAEFLVILLKTGAKVQFKGFIYSAFDANGYPIVIRDPV